MHYTLFLIMKSVHTKVTNISSAGLEDARQRSKYAKCPIWWLIWTRQRVTNRAICVCSDYTVTTLRSVTPDQSLNKVSLGWRLNLHNLPQRHTVFKIVPRSCISSSCERRWNNLIISPPAVHHFIPTWKALASITISSSPLNFYTFHL